MIQGRIEAIGEFTKVFLHRIEQEIAFWRTFSSNMGSRDGHQKETIPASRKHVEAG
jgi:hypothetical protein